MRSMLNQYFSCSRMNEVEHKQTNTHETTHKKKKYRSVQHKKRTTRKTQADKTQHNTAKHIQYSNARTRKKQNPIVKNSFPTCFFFIFSFFVLSPDPLILHPPTNPSYAGSSSLLKHH